MTQRRSRAYLKKVRKISIFVRLAAMVIAIAAVIIGAIWVFNNVKPEGGEKVITEEAVYNPGPPLPSVVSRATVGATGDILLHNAVISDGETESGYDFIHMFSDISGYWGNYDYMVANLEGSLGGPESGEYSGYPAFNSPDEIVTALKIAGVDCLLTANNHAYDTGEYGFIRTQEVINGAELDHLGTRLSGDDSFVLIKDINGINFGFACYTYDTRNQTDWAISLNANVMSEATAGNVNSFTYDDLGNFFDRVAADVQYMKDNGCDVNVFFIHWGNEYEELPNDTQIYMAQELCNRGVDFIIGDHPHVIQRFDILNSQVEDHTTYCLYSTGNALSSQRKEMMDPEEPRGYTEDGVTISFSYMKLNNGKIKLTDLYMLPTWVDVDVSTYNIVPLEQSMIVSKWQTSSVDESIASYNRTMERLGTVYPEARAYLGLSQVKPFIEN